MRKFLHHHRSQHLLRRIFHFHRRVRQRQDRGGSGFGRRGSLADARAAEEHPMDVVSPVGLLPERTEEEEELRYRTGNSRKKKIKIVL
ncbi:hypothetical protein L484_025216 [Morus notabilis]|uniref:Uncharacterized protein n=1 Tax=Morus notabilis TaxID=981085 RepID=W9RUC4_9ROSA|nr:hypothetical protein L484_025216 [Morus notabilis]